MLPKKTALAAAGTTVMVIITITTAIALNIGLLRSAQPADSGAATVDATTAEPQIQTVVVEVPAQGAPVELIDQSLGAPVPAPAAPAQVVARSATPARAAVQAAAAASPVTQAAAPAAPVTQAPAPAAPVTQAAAPTTQAPATTAAPAVQTEYLTFPMGSIGDVVIANHGGNSLEFWSAYPTDGWRFMVEKPTGREIEIKFEKDGNEAKMQVKLDGGDVEVEREGI